MIKLPVCTIHLTAVVKVIQYGYLLLVANTLELTNITYVAFLTTIMLSIPGYTFYLFSIDIRLLLIIAVVNNPISGIITSVSNEYKPCDMVFKNITPEMLQLILHESVAEIKPV